MRISVFPLVLVALLVIMFLSRDSVVKTNLPAVEIAVKTGAQGGQTAETSIPAQAEEGGISGIENAEGATDTAAANGDSGKITEEDDITKNTTEEAWYISNGSGMLLEKTYKTRALREKYAVCLRKVKGSAVPREIRKYYIASWQVQCRILYEDRRRIRTQWVYKDSINTTLFAAVVGEDGSGFLEWYDANGYIIEEQRLSRDGSGYFVAYRYKSGFLLRSEAHIVDAAPQKAKPPPVIIDAGETVASQTANPAGPAPIPGFFVAVTGREGGRLWTDNYRYTRNDSLRAIERTYYNAGETNKIIKNFSYFVKNSRADREFIQPGTSFASEFLEDVLSDNTAKTEWTFDNRQRVTSEVRKDSEGNVIGEMKNNWSRDRIDSVEWNTKDDKRVIEYKYDKNGDRIEELDYRNGILERTVRMEDDGREVEELYLEGEVVLRAIWEGGKKISEERILNVNYR